MQDPHAEGPPAGAPPLDIRQIERPSSSLLAYYALASLLGGPLFPLLFLPRLFRYLTLRYTLDEEGVSARWGVLFRREIHLTYSRIQDIHLSSNLFERWLSLARIEIQTASGSSKAELTIEGVHEFDALRDFIYARMRGQRGLNERQGAGRVGPAPGAAPSVDPRLVAALEAVTRELRTVRETLERRGAPPAGP